MLTKTRQGQIEGLPVNGGTAYLGIRFGEPPVAKPFAPQEVEVLRDAYGRPRLELHGEAALAAQNLGVRHIWVSLTHEGDNAGAMVVLEG